MRFLLITSRPPAHSAGLGQDVANALLTYGHKVNILSLYGQKNQPDYMNSIYPYKKDIVGDIIESLRNVKLLRRFWVIIRKYLNLQFKTKSKYIRNNGISFVYPCESKPHIPINKVLANITTEYDAVISLFWQDFITSETLKAIYQRLRCPIIIYSVDMAPFTGGCYYFGDCRNFYSGCGRCPALDSHELADDSNHNFAIKKANYSQMECYYLGNTWMNNFARKSNIFKADHIKLSSLVLNSRDFSPEIKETDKIRLPKGKDFGILFRATHNLDIRKGELEFEKLMQSIFDNLSPQERSRIIILPVGKILDKDRKARLKFDVMDIGSVSCDTLKNIYRISSVFVSLSLDDAGPSMVNQSMMCGTPVIAFNIGTAIDVINDGINGFKAPIKAIDPLAKGLLKLIRDRELLTEMSLRAREKALNVNSYEAFVNNITDILRSSKTNRISNPN